MIVRMRRGGRGPKRAFLYTFSVGTNIGLSHVLDARMSVVSDNVQYRRGQ